MNGMRINYGYHPDEAQGYGRMGVKIAQALAELGVVNLGGIHRRDGSLAASVGGYTNEEAKELAPVAFWCSTPPHVTGWYKGQMSCIATMWEGSQIPPGFRENVPHFDRVFVPSLQCKELYAQFHPDVRYVPLGVDPHEWHYMKRTEPTREFRFLTAGAGPRKNCEMVRDAFYRVFSDYLDGAKGPIPKLVIRAKDAEPGRNIEPIATPLSNQAEIDLYANAHCYVSGSCAEGWGLMPNQAIAQGLPTILGNAHGHAAFAHYGIPLDTHSAPAADGTFYGKNGSWWEPDFQQMCDAMKSVYDNYERYCRRAVQSALEINNEYTWDRTAAKLVYNMPELFDEAPTERVWTQAPERLYHVRVITPKTYTINGQVFRYEPGVDYYEPADMKMRLGDSGALEPSVIDPVEMGIEAAASFTEKSNHTLCPTCRQRLNTNNPLMEMQDA